jgi:DNA segregation ATPase FtsK/SpoIIIE, S-DNA-T family
MAKRRKRKQTKVHMELKYYVVSILALSLIIISLFSFGLIGELLDTVLRDMFGYIPHFVILLQLLYYFLYMLVKAEYLGPTSRYVVGSFFILFGILVLFGGIDSPEYGMDAINMEDIDGSNLGMFQLLVYGLASSLFGKSGSIVIALSFIFIGIIIYFMISVSTIIQTNREKLATVFQGPNGEKVSKFSIIKDFFSTNDIEEYIEEFEEEIDDEEEEEAQEIIIDKKIDLDQLESAQNYQLPSFDLLKNPMSTDPLAQNQKYANKKATLLANFLKEFDLDVNISKINIGPSVTKFELTLSAGIRVNRIANLADDIKMALAVKEMRIEAPIPGKSAIGIEIPNYKNTLITLKEVLNDINYKKENKLVFGLGRDINGQSIYTSLNQMPHLLVAGSTGSGKSVCINAIIVSILMNAHYDEVKFLLIDPKRVELNIYDGLPQLIAPVITNPKSASIALKKVVQEMDNRYQILANHNCKNIEAYNEYVEKINQKANDENKLARLPYIVVVIDELADLMMISPKDVEECIMRITQMARAAGIHLIVATQRPSTDVMTGIIKANIPSRIAFAVSSSIDSRTILDMSGAEKLLGNGDMLFYPTGINSSKRVQGAFLSDEEVGKVVYAIKSQNITTQTDENFENLDAPVESDSSSGNSTDSLYGDVEEYVKKLERISISQLQRAFKVGYNRAACLVDDLEAAGIVSGANGSKPREVLIKSEELE